MKRSLYFYMGCLFLMASIPSCQKSEVIPRQLPSVMPQPPQTQTLNIFVTNWERGTNEVYTSTLRGILNYKSGANVRVYVSDTSRVLLISSGGIVFMNGHLRADFSHPDIQLVYQYFGTDAQVPFSSLHIKVVFQE